MKEIEISAKTVGEAIQTALEELGVEEDQVEVVVLKKGRSGLLGMGSEDAKVKVKLLANNNVNSDVVNMASEVLNTLIESMGLSAKVTADKGEADSLPVTLNVEGDDLGILIGRHGQTLAALQYIVRLIVANQAKARVPVVIDVEGYKQRRYEALQALAHRMAEQVKARKRPFALEPMPAYERRIIHLALADDPDVATESVGDGEARKVVITPRSQR